MRKFRRLSDDEKALVVALLKAKNSTRDLIASLDGLSVEEMTDGGMGSLRLIPKGCEEETRSFRKEIALAEFNDSDGTPVSVSLNLDNKGRLFELDVWKVDFRPLLGWPDPATLKIIERGTVGDSPPK